MSYAITTVTAQVFVLLLTLITNKVAATSLSISDYAIYGQVVLLSSLIGAFCTSGLQNCMLSSDVKDKVSLRVYFILGGIVSILLLILIKVGVIHDYLLIEIDNYLSPFLLLLIPFLYQMFIYKQAKIISSKVRMHFIIFNVLNATLCCVVIVLSIYFNNFYLTIGFLLMRPGVLGFLALTNYIKKIELLSLFSVFQEREQVRGVLGFLFYGIISTSAFFIYSTITRFIISETYDVQTVGYFYTAQRLFELLLGLSLTYYSSFYFKQLSHLKNTVEIIKVVLKNSLSSFLVFFLISIFILYYADEVVLALFSEKQLSAVMFFEPLIVNLLLGAVVYSIGFALIAKVNKFFMSALEIIYLIIFCVFAYFIEREYIAWLFPIIMMIKLMFNVTIFYKVFYAK